MPYRAQIDDHGVVTRYKDTDTGEVISAKEYEMRQMQQHGGYSYQSQMPQASPYAMGGSPYSGGLAPAATGLGGGQLLPPPPAMPVSGYPGSSTAAPLSPMGGGMPSAYSGQMPGQMPGQMSPAMPSGYPAMPGTPIAMGGGMGAGGGLTSLSNSQLIQPGAQMLNGMPGPPATAASAPAAPGMPAGGENTPPTAGVPQQGKNLRLEGNPWHQNTNTHNYKTHGFLDATSIAILLPTLVLLALIIAAAHKKRLFPWQTIRTFNPPSGLMTPRDYERSYVCPPNLRRHGRLGKRNPAATWVDQDGIVLPFGFLARTHLPITIPLGRLPNKNMFIVAPSGSGKTTLMRAIIKALMAKPCVIIALEAKANDPTLDEKRESFKHTLLPEAQTAGFDPLYFNPLDPNSIHWNPLDLDAITFASSIVQDINSLDAEEQHWAERDHGYITGLTQLLKWGAVMVSGEDENGQPTDVQPLPCNPRGLMRLVNNRRNIVESLRRCKNNPDVNAAELSELTQTLSSIIRTDSDWDKNIQGVRGRLRMFKNPNVLRCTEASNIDIKACMHKATVLIFGAPASMGPDAESLASTFVYQLQNAMHTRYGTKSALPLFAFFDEYQTLNMDIAGRLSAIVRGANGGLTIILQNISQIAQIDGSGGGSGVSPELKTIFSNSAVRVCLHNADESTAKFFSDEIGKHAIIVPGISDHYDANGFGIFPTSWNRIHSQQVVPRVDADSIKRMEKHHALVFLSPAGDPEFGELKPFMCDLRGIEEIARLHLLHNVTGRGPGQEAPGAEGELPQAPGGAPMQLPPGAKLGSPVLAGMMSPQALEKAQQILGPNGQPVQMPAAAGQGAGAMGGPPSGMPIPHGAPMPVAAGTPVAPGMPIAAAAAAGLAGVAAVGAAAAMGGAGRPPFPGGAVPAAPQQMPPGVPVPNPQVAAGAPRPGVPMAQPAAAPMAAPAAPAGADRICGKCGKWPGKGRFCIECGTFVGQPGGAAAPAAAPMAAPVAAPVAAPAGMPVGASPVPMTVPMQQPTGVPTAAPAMPAGTPVGYAQPGAAAQPQQGAAGRQPLTSLHGDMTKYGVPNTAAPQAPSDQPGQSRMPRPQQRGGGIEF